MMQAVGIANPEVRGLYEYPHQMSGGHETACYDRHGAGLSRHRFLIRPNEPDNSP